MSDLHERLTRAFIDVFAGRVPGYGVHLECVADDGSEVDLVVTFLSGLRYCCFEPACHFAYYGERGWVRVRECMDRHGLNALPLPVIRKFCGVIEPGAVMMPSPVGPAVVWEGSEYEVGPFHPILS